VCSVAHGSVRVRTQGRDFQIGPNGMWTVAGGVECMVGNHFYLPAVLHVTGVEEEV
jgi:hypothetical protein